MRGTIVGVLSVLAMLGAGAPAQAANTQCPEPEGRWTRVPPAEEGFDAAKLQAAMDYGSSQLGYSVRVFRNGCLVGADVNYRNNRDARYESWSLGKSVTSLIYGRAMTLGLLSPDDPVGALLPEADAPHGAIRVRDLLTATSGLQWNGTRDYDIAMPDRLKNALSTPVAREPGSFFEYSQDGPALLAEAVGRAVGEDFQAFAQRELFTPLGIAPGDWTWTRDSKGHTQGFFGVQMRTDDYAKLGELMRRGGVWKGKRLLSKRYVRRAVSPSTTNGCYGWLIWVNAAKPCIGPTVTERPVRDSRYFPDLPTNTFHFEGLLGQVVTVLPTQGIVVARNGSQDPGTFAGGADTEAELYRRVLGALTDGTSIEVAPGGTVPADGGRPNPDEGFQHFALDQLLAPFTLPDLPAAGPARARAVRVGTAPGRVGRRGRAGVGVLCPKVSAAPCTGTVAATGGPLRTAVASAPFTVAPGTTRTVRVRLTRAARKRLARRGRGTVALTATAADATPGGTVSTGAAVLRRPR